MRKLLLGVFLILSVVVFSFEVQAQTATLTPTPTESSLVTTPVVTNTPIQVASGSATPTKITSLPKTGFIQYSAVFFVISAGIILIAFVF